MALVGCYGQGSISRSGHRCCRYICAFIEENLTHLYITAVGCLHQRCQPSFCSMLQVGLPICKYSDDLVSALEASESECRVPVRLDLSVDVAAQIQQQAHASGVAVHRRQHQRRDTQLAACSRVDLGAVLQQDLDDFDEPARSCLTERSVVGDVAMLPLGAAFQEELHDFSSSVGAGDRERRVLRLVGLRIYGCTGVEEKLHADQMTRTGGMHERRETLLISVLDVGSFREQKICEIRVATSAGERQRGFVFIFRLSVDFDDGTKRQRRSGRFSWTERVNGVKRRANLEWLGTQILQM